MVHKITEKVVIWEVLGCKLTFWPPALRALEEQQSLQKPFGAFIPISNRTGHRCDPSWVIPRWWSVSALGLDGAAQGYQQLDRRVLRAEC